MYVRRGISLLLLLTIAGVTWGDEEPTAKLTTQAMSDCGCAEPTTSELPSGNDPPCYCLQQKWLDYPGPYDLFICRVYLEDCEEDGEEDLWYGAPTDNHLPQICESGQCEPAESFRGGEDDLPGHDLMLNSTSAWAMAEAALESASSTSPKLDWSDPEFHEIERENIPAGLGIAEDILVMAVPISGKLPNDNTFYLCIQIDSLDPESDDEMTDARFDAGKSGTGRQFVVYYRAHGERRKGLVWLK